MDNTDPTTGNQKQEEMGSTTSSAPQGTGATQEAKTSQGAASSPETKDTKGQPAVAQAWMAQLEGDLKNDGSLTKFKTISELGKAYKSLEEKLGNAIWKPADDATEEEVKAFYNKLGAPVILRFIRRS